MLTLLFCLLQIVHLIDHDGSDGMHVVLSKSNFTDAEWKKVMKKWNSMTSRIDLGMFRLSVSECDINRKLNSNSSTGLEEFTLPEQVAIPFLMQEIIQPKFTELFTMRTMSIRLFDQLLELLDQSDIDVSLNGFSKLTIPPVEIPDMKDYDTAQLHIQKPAMQKLLQDELLAALRILSQETHIVVIPSLLQLNKTHSYAEKYDMRRLANQTEGEREY